MLYNLGVGAKKTDLPLVFEGHEDFQALPSFGVIPFFSAETPYNISDVVPNFNPMMLLHGEQYLEVLSYPIPTSATLISHSKLLEVVDKGNAAIVKSGITTINKATNTPLFYNESTVFIRGSGNFGGQRKPLDRGASTAPNPPPKRTPDHITEEQTTPEQAVLYRLSGDYNPLHVDPAFAKMGGFNVPILHGLCFFGFAAKALYSHYGAFRNIKVRFAGTVLPGQTIVTEMWKEGGGRIVFQCKVKETGKLCISGGAAELVGGKEKGKI
jgi:multifunctional beta-oxidation protein